jgi:hypothetical protein
MPTSNDTSVPNVWEIVRNISFPNRWKPGGNRGRRETGDRRDIPRFPRCYATKVSVEGVSRILFGAGGSGGNRGQTGHFPFPKTLRDKGQRGGSQSNSVRGGCPPSEHLRTGCLRYRALGKRVGTDEVCIEDFHSFQWVARFRATPLPTRRFRHNPQFFNQLPRFGCSTRCEFLPLNAEF